jgi:quinol monooxygenase YgiN
VLVVTRFSVDPAEGDAFLARARAALSALASRPGYLAGRIGRATDDPALWVLSTEWVGVGAYRRALSAYDVKVTAVPVLSEAIDEPSAYEVLVETAEDAAAARPSRRAADADTVGIGRASGPDVPTGLGRSGADERSAPAG